LIKPDILIKSKRKSLSLTVNNNGELIVHAPQKMRLEEVFNFVEKKQDWIINKKDKINNILQMNKKILNYEQILFLGKVYYIVKVKGIKETILENGYLCIPEYIKDEKVPVVIKNWMLNFSEEIILDRLDYFAELMDLNFRSVKVVNSRAKWGSCDNNLNLSFNFKMAMLPPSLVDYIIVHELSHILEFNHSYKFWEVVASIIPTYKKQRQKLKNSSFLLSLFVKKRKTTKKSY
jgi:predicted metal-dependent hydrolase